MGDLRVRTVSWEQLISIKQEAREIAKEEREKPPAECPNDGEPLIFARGVWHCKFDGYVTRGKREV